MVSTEDPEIEAISKQTGAEVLRRPKYLATDTALTTDVLKHVLGEIRADIVVLLSPTSPIRVNNIIDQSIERFLESGADTLATGYVSTYYEWGTVPEMPRQKMKGYFVWDGTVYVNKAELVISVRFFGDRLERMIVPHIYHPYPLVRFGVIT